MKQLDSIMGTEVTVTDCLLARLKEIGVDHIFGVPGDFVLGFFNRILKSDIKYVGTCNELNSLLKNDFCLKLFSGSNV